jgi:hypothetical protein
MTQVHMSIVAAKVLAGTPMHLRNSVACVNNKNLPEGQVVHAGGCQLLNCHCLCLRSLARTAVHGVTRTHATSVQSCELQTKQIASASWATFLFE